MSRFPQKNRFASVESEKNLTSTGDFDFFVDNFGVRASCRK
jgi:hypothetical protein